MVTFLNSKTLDGFLKFIHTKLGIKKDNIFLYKSLSGDDKIFATFRILGNYEKINLNNDIRNTSIIHKKGSTYYTINALNKLIEQTYNLDIGNIAHKDYSINWDEYQNMFILLINKGLVKIPVEKFLHKS